MKGLFITGTGTGVGKTTIAQLLISYLRTKYNIKVRKPVESGCVVVDGKYIANDARLLHIAADNNELLDSVCPYKFSDISSPEQASIATDKVLLLDDLINACRDNINSNDFVVIEGAGGFYTPIAKDSLNSDLIASLDIPIIIIIKDELGCVNHTLLTIAAVQKHNFNIAAIVLNSFSKNNLDNKKAIEKYSKIPLLTYCGNVDDFMLQLDKVF